MQKIKALREFSHYHLGTVDQGQIKEVGESEAEALVGMGLAELVEGPDADQKQEPTAAKPKPVKPPKPEAAK